MKRRGRPAGHARRGASKVRGAPETPTVSSPNKRDETAPSEAGEPDSSLSLPVVGVGASAGGLEALTHLLNHLRADTGMAFVLIQHLAPARVSMLPELLSKASAMRVREAEHGSILEPNVVYVLPADKDMIVSQGVLSLSPRSEVAGAHHPIDRFLRSLAANQKSGAIAVILSGSGSDGALGVQAVKNEGGITFAQDEQSAQHWGMPQSAIATGCVDFILPPAEIAGELGRLGGHPYMVRAPAAEPTAVGRARPEEASLKRIFALLRNRFGIDFSYYHPGTIQRRLQRRMALTRTGTVAEYAEYLPGQKQEVDALFSDLLVKTTSFFRDPETFEFLQRKICPSLLKGRSGGAAEAPLRVWVPACATGEEAYSIAIALIEAAESAGSHAGMQFFASDVSETAVSLARKGVYPENISGDVSPERLRRFFVRHGAGYEVSESLRRMFVFAKQDLLRNPPFSRMDLVSCRNLLIYLAAEAQSRVLSLLHYSLKPGGVLLLGSAETVGQGSRLFHRIDREHKVFSKQPAEAHAALPGPLRRYAEEQPRVRENAPVDLQAEADRLILQRYSHPSLLVNEDLNILQFRGDTSPFVRPAAGKASLNLLDMVREELRLGLRAAIVQARKGNVPVKKPYVRLTGRGGPRNVGVEVAPVKAGSLPERLFLVVFHEGGVPPAQKAEKGRAAGPTGASAVVARLRKELAETKEEIKSVVEDQQATVEELQAANEELQSANEELQSTNEELETSKEEIEAGNEELTTVNVELQERNRELSNLGKFVGAVFDSVREPLVVLDGRLRVRRANRSFYEMFGVSAEETVGRSIAEVGARQWAIPELTQALDKVLSAQSTVEKFEVTADFPHLGHRRMTLNARPVRFHDEPEPEVLLAIEDTTAEAIIAEQAKVIQYLPTPVLPIGNRVLVQPLVGVPDHVRMKQLKDQLLAAIRQHRAQVAVVDITGVETLDAAAAQSLVDTAVAARLLGATIILTGISRRAAQVLVTLDIGLPGLMTMTDLQSGLEEANRLLGYEVITQRELASLRAAARELKRLQTQLENEPGQPASE